MSTAVAEMAAPEVAVGDFFVCSWGYDQTNIDFYKVVARTPKGVRVQRWQKSIVGGGGPQEQVVPGKDAMTFMDWSLVTPGMDYQERKDKAEVPVEVEFHRLRYWGDRPVFTVNSFSMAYYWDGKPESQTGAGWGR